jgi:RNA polymerase sigma-70 factor (ECF subfamily)
MPKESDAPRRSIVYCIVPEDLADRLHAPLRNHYAAQPRIDVVVEQRWRERRKRTDRRVASDPEPPLTTGEQRRIRAAEGRRAAERRALAVSIAVPGELPRKVRPYVDRLAFVERVAPSGQQSEDADTARLVARFQSGDSDVFSELYLRYFDRIYAYVLVAINEAHEAEDAAQQIFMQVLEALPRYERRRQPFRAWLFTIARNYTIRLVEKHHRLDIVDPEDLRHAREAEDSARPPLDALDWISDRELLMFIERLPLPQRQALHLRFVLDFSNAEIGLVMGRNQDDVRRLQHRALRFLEARLTAVGREASSGNSIRMRRWVPQAQVLRRRRFALLP